MFLRAYQRRTAQGIQPSHHRSFAQWIVSAQDSIRFAATAALLTATAITLYAELRSSPCSLPRILYIIGMAVMVGSRFGREACFFSWSSGLRNIGFSPPDLGRRH